MTANFGEKGEIASGNNPFAITTLRKPIAAIASEARQSQRVANSPGIAAPKIIPLLIIRERVMLYTEFQKFLAYKWP